MARGVIAVDSEIDGCLSRGDAMIAVAISHVHDHCCAVAICLAFDCRDLARSGCRLQPNRAVEICLAIGGRFDRFLAVPIFHVLLEPMGAVGRRWVVAVCSNFWQQNGRQRRRQILDSAQHQAWNNESVRSQRSRANDLPAAVHYLQILKSICGCC